MPDATAPPIDMPIDMPLDAPLDAGKLRRGTPAFRRACLAVFAASFSTFALLYCVQPLLPAFSREFGVGAAESSLALSCATLSLAWCMLAAGALSDSWNRKAVMAGSIASASVLTIGLSLIPGWHGFLAARTLVGVTAGGLPALAVAYLSEEMHPDSVGLAMGLYVGGNGLGGMAGRMLTGLLSEAVGWHAALAGIGAMGLAAAGLFWWGLPPSRTRPRRLDAARILAGYGRLLRDPVLPWLMLAGFMLLGELTIVYNTMTYRLMAPPWRFGQGRAGLVFAVYLVGVASSAWMGALAGRRGREGVFRFNVALMLAGGLLTLAPGLPWIVLGLALVTFGYFGAHAIACAWVGARAGTHKAQASSLYLWSFYMGGSILGSLGGWGWDRGGWPGVVALDAAMAAAALAIAWRLRRLA